MPKYLAKTLFGACALALFASSAAVAAPRAACYRDLCPGDHVAGNNGKSLYGTVESVKADGSVTVLWHYANGWPFTARSVWPYSQLKKM